MTIRRAQAWSCPQSSRPSLMRYRRWRTCATRGPLRGATAGPDLRKPSPKMPEVRRADAHHRLRNEAAADPAHLLGHQRTDPVVHSAAGAIAATAGVRVRSDARDRRLAGDGRDGRAGSGRMGVIPVKLDRNGPRQWQCCGWGRVSANTGSWRREGWERRSGGDRGGSIDFRGQGEGYSVGARGFREGVG